LGARLLGYSFELFCLLVGRESFIFFDVLLLFPGVLADRLDFVFLVLRQVQRVIVFDGVRIRRGLRRALGGCLSCLSLRDWKREADS